MRHIEKRTRSFRLWNSWHGLSGNASEVRYTTKTIWWRCVDGTNHLTFSSLNFTNEHMAQSTAELRHAVSTFWRMSFHFQIEKFLIKIQRIVFTLVWKMNHGLLVQLTLKMHAFFTCLNGVSQLSFIKLLGATSVRFL